MHQLGEHPHAHDHHILVHVDEHQLQDIDQGRADQYGHIGDTVDRECVHEMTIERDDPHSEVPRLHHLGVGQQESGVSDQPLTDIVVTVVGSDGHDKLGSIVAEVAVMDDIDGRLQ